MHAPSLRAWPRSAAHVLLGRSPRALCAPRGIALASAAPERWCVRGCQRQAMQRHAACEPACEPANEPANEHLHAHVPAHLSRHERCGGVWAGWKGVATPAWSCFVLHVCMLSRTWVQDGLGWVLPIYPFHKGNAKKGSLQVQPSCSTGILEERSCQAPTQLSIPVYTNWLVKQLALFMQHPHPHASAVLICPRTGLGLGW